MTDENELAREESLKHLRDVRDAYLQVFGPPEHRTPLGAIILQDLERFCRYQDEILYVSKQSGVSDPHVTHYQLGKQTVINRIHTRINWSEHGRRSNRSDDPHNAPVSDNGNDDAGSTGGNWLRKLARMVRIRT